MGTGICHVLHVKHPGQYDKHHNNGDDAAAHASRPEGTVDVCRGDSHRRQQRRGMVANRRHNHHHAVDEELCILDRPYPEPARPVHSIGDSPMCHSIEIHKAPASGTAQRTGHTHRLRNIEGAPRAQQAHTRMRSRRTAACTCFQSHYRTSAIYGHTHIAGVPVAAYGTDSGALPA